MTAHRIVGLALILGAVACAHASTFATARNATQSETTTGTTSLTSHDVLAREASNAHATAHATSHADFAESAGGGATSTSAHGLELRPESYRPITLGDPCGACR